MNLKNEALKMAIELMERFLEYDGISSSDYIDVMNACKAALEQPVQEPLSDDEITAIFVRHGLDNVEMAGNHIDVVLLMRDVEQAHGIGVNK